MQILRWHDQPALEEKTTNTWVKFQKRENINEICVDNLNSVMQHGASASWNSWKIKE